MRDAQRVMRPYPAGAARPREAFPEGFVPPEQSGGLHDVGKILVTPLLTVAVLFFCFHLWRIGNVNVTLSDALFMIVVLIELGLGRLNGSPFGTLTPIWLGSLVLMLTGLFVGSYVNGDLVRWIIVAGQYLFSYMLLPMVLIRDIGTINRLIVTLIIGVTGMESLGIVIYYTMDGWTQANAIFGPDFITGGRRLGAMVGDANWNSAVIAMTLPFVLYAGIRRLIPVPAALIAGVMLMWALMLAASFTGFSAALLALAVMAFFGRLRPSPQMILLAGALAVGLYAAGYQMPDIFAKRVAPAFQNGDLEEAGTYDDRAELIAEAWGNAENTVIIGMGVDQFREFSPSGQPVHNMYMLELAEGGIVALMGWLGVAMSLALIPLTRLREHRLEAALSLGVIAVFQVFTMASPHMYARLWTIPVLLSLGAVLKAGPSPLWAGRSPQSVTRPRAAWNKIRRTQVPRRR
ncbi:MAG: hypothetical protein QM605_00110 [Sphingobium sp.]